MKRREFLKTSVAASTLLGLGSAEAVARPGADAAGGKHREHYELRVYHLKSPDNRPLLDSYLSKALLPALNRLGSKPVGVFAQQERAGTTQPSEVTDALAVLVLIPYPNIAAFASTSTRLADDQEFLAAGAEYLQSPKDKPAFTRIDSWLMLAFAGMPKIELPAYCRESKPRMFEMRTYESHSELKALKKVEMFNSGEIQLMRDVGLGPIFYGQALIGSNLPHLTYMLSAEDQAAHSKHWDAFKKSPIWEKLQKDPQYADTVSKINNRFLVPTAYSQI
ncbi:MAG TPA: NIPSNAP family protein [Candidatus Acidoferrum sp.]|nr:NIPSNAP family protein [Candidatus Acidoferrum sp.]